MARRSRPLLRNAHSLSGHRGGGAGAPRAWAARAAHHAAGAVRRFGKHACLRACGSAAAPLGVVRELAVNEMEPLLDRAQELTQLRDSLRRFRLVALVGPAGIGKTTLARQLARSHAEDFPRGIHFVEGYQIGRGFEQSAGPLLAEIEKYGQEGTGLLVIDGINELPARTADELLAQAARSRGDLRILVTSRQPILEADSTLTLGSLTSEEVENLLARYGVSGSVASVLAGRLGGHPFLTSVAGSLIREGRFHPGELISHLREFQASGVVLPDGRALDAREEPIPSLRLELAGINEHLLRRLEQDIGLARELSPRKFEELVAELLARQGYVVELTPASKDGGKDIYVARRDDLGAFLYLVECKKYALDNPVGVEIVRALYGTVQAERATAGVLVTTSVFTKGARDFQRHVQYQVSLRDYVELHRWIRQALHGGDDA